MVTDARYAQYESLLRVLFRLEARRDGISLADIEEIAGVQRRAAERMRDALMRALPNLEEHRDGSNKRWVLGQSAVSKALSPSIDDIAALSRAEAVLSRDGDAATAALLSSLADRLRAGLEKTARLRFDIDLEALLEADGVVRRPGPREQLDPAVIGLLRAAILGGSWVEADMASTRTGRMSWGNRIGPIAFLLGEGRQYLVGYSDYREQVQLFRLSNLTRVKVLSEAFEAPDDFDLEAWLDRSFGTWQDEPHDVEWRFSVDAAQDAHNHRFHPTQEFTEEADGSLTLRFTACGLDEMCWHLFRWGSGVEVIAPDALRERYAQMLADAIGRADQDG